MDKKFVVILFIAIYALFESEIQHAINELSLESKIIIAVAFIGLALYIYLTQ